MARRIVYHLRENHGPRRRQRPPRPPLVQRARMPVTNGLLPRRRRVDRLQRQGDFNEFLSWSHALSISVHAGSSARVKQLGKVVIDARDPEIRLTLEGPTHVVHAVRIAIQELDDGEDKILGLVEGVENFVLGDGDGRGARDAALHFQKT